LEGLKNTTTNLSQDIWRPDPDSNRAPTDRYITTNLFGNSFIVEKVSPYIFCSVIHKHGRFPAAADVFVFTVVQ
jgi:hypothetical protein